MGKEDLGPYPYHTVIVRYSQCIISGYNHQGLSRKKYKMQDISLSTRIRAYLETHLHGKTQLHLYILQGSAGSEMNVDMS
jgi:hypothetical protein